MKKLMIISLCSMLMTWNMADVNDKVEIEKLIYQLMKGVDTQDGELILAVFRSDATLQATNQGKIISVDYKQYAELHNSKKFGGQKREVEISNIDLTDGIIASAKVIAQNESLHYVYYLNFSNTDGKWLIQGFLQHAKVKK